MTIVDQSSATTEQNADAWETLKCQMVSVWPPENWARVGVLVGCSGGADSTALLVAMADAFREFHTAGNSPKGFLTVAHFDHGIRGNESKEDAQFVEELAEQLDLHVVSAQGDGQSNDEASLRAQRREFLRRAAHSTGCRYIALAHSLDDNVETALHNLLRGSGSRGIAAMSVFGSLERGSRGEQFPDNQSIDSDLVVARPLLRCTRELIRSALLERGIEWREDSSNQDEAYRRNWIRKKLLPLIESQYPDAVFAIDRASRSLHESQECLVSLADTWLECFLLQNKPLTLGRFLTTDQHQGEKLKTKILVSQPAIVIEALKKLWRDQGWPLGDMGFRHWRKLLDAILNAQKNDDSRFQLPGNIDCHVKESRIVLEERASVT